MIWWTWTHLGWDSCQACLMTSLHFSLPSCLLLPSRHTCILTFLWLQLWTAHNTMCNTPSWIDHGCRVKKSSALLMQYGFHPLDLRDLLEATLKKRCPFHHRRLECKSRQSRDTWRTRQVWLCSTEWRSKTNRLLSREHTAHRKHTFPTTQDITLHMDIIRWSILKSDWLYSLQPKLEKLYTLSKNKTWSWLWLRSSAPHYKIQA